MSVARAREPVARAAALKSDLAAGRVRYGLFITTVKSAAMIDASADAGLDFVVLDTAHYPFDETEVAQLCRIAVDRGVTPLVRTPPDPVQAERMLDFGAMGVMWPGAASVAEVQAAIAHFYYPPAGTRGFSTRAAGTAAVRQVLPSGASRAELLAAANDAVVVVVQIETASLAAEVDALVGTAGIDVLAVGHNDLAISEGEPDRSAVGDRERLLRWAPGAGLPQKQVSLKGGAEQISDAVFIVVGHDTDVLEAGLAAKLENAVAGVARRDVR